jgi:hypothetical protein
LWPGFLQKVASAHISLHQTSFILGGQHHFLVLRKFCTTYPEVPPTSVKFKNTEIPLDSSPKQTNKYLPHPEVLKTQTDCNTSKTFHHPKNLLSKVLTGRVSSLQLGIQSQVCCLVFCLHIKKRRSAEILIGDFLDV